MNATLTHSPSRRRPPLFLECRAPSAASGSRAAGARVPLAPPSSAPPPAPARVDLPLPHPAPERRFRQIQSKGGAVDLGVDRRREGTAVAQELTDLGRRRARPQH